MIYSFRTNNHPEANGRHPQAGDEAYPIKFGLEEEGILFVECGRIDFMNIAACILALLNEDEEMYNAVVELSKSVEYGGNDGREA